jgi:hypothetical protein
MKRFVLILMAALLCALPALAQQEKGDTELQLQGSLSLALDEDLDDSGTVNVLFGRFFTRGQEIGATVRADISGDGDVGGAAGPFYRYNFLTGGKTVPYLGAAAVATFGENQGGGDVQLDLEGGSRWFLSRNMAFTLSGVYSYDVDASEFADRLRVLFGFSYLWNK